jgi:hypothetical protein
MPKVPKKRGRKPKKKSDVEKTKPPPKKRGRKPKGGKIIKKNKIVKKTNTYIPNVILHLKTSEKNLDMSQEITNFEYVPNISEPISYNINQGKTSNLNFKEINSKIIETDNNKKCIPVKQIDTPKKQDKLTKNSMKEIWEKLKQLRTNLRHNNVSDKSCACFWDTCQFDSPPIYIPKKIKDDKIHVYGCFCSPECALSYLKQENLDSSTMWNRYSLLNIIYGEIYNYEKSIKPAPNPFYTLDKYYGNFTISEWRKLLNNDRLIMVVDKPMSKILPEIYEENNEEPHITNNLLDTTINKRTSYKLKSRETPKSKADILKTNFKVF